MKATQTKTKQRGKISAAARAGWMEEIQESAELRAHGIDFISSGDSMVLAITDELGTVIYDLQIREAVRTYAKF